MSKVRKNESRENRIIMEIIVDAYGPEEQAIGWYYYLDDTLNFPFLSKCITKRVISPLKVGDEVEVIGMAPEEECEHEMFVMMRWERNGLAIPLMQLEVIHGDDQTREAVEDWHYWVNRGYGFA
ncbi:MAG: calcium-binding protein [Thermodesulfobacteriota bacterium]|nr:calcium-binding protein [Thermodesulfobacteriota bacterium]